MNIKGFLIEQKMILEDLFGSEWFRHTFPGRACHPAYKKWKFCCEMIDQGGEIVFPVQREQFTEIVSLMLDCYVLLGASGGDLHTFRLGDFGSFGDEKVQKRIRSVIYDPKQFSSLLTEFSFAAWCASKGFRVTPFEEENYPDFRIDIGHLNLPIVVECKKIEEGTGSNRFKKIICKANKQIKSVAHEAYGLVIVDITNIIERQKEFSDRLPQDVQTMQEHFRCLLRKFNSSVSGALLFWDEYTIFGEDDPEAIRASVFVRRRSCVVEHDQPKHKWPDNSPFREFGNTVMFRVGAA